MILIVTMYVMTLMGSLSITNDLKFPIEHDGSLSRADYYEGNDHNFNQEKWNQVLAYYKGMENTNIKQASLARYNRIKVQRALNPTFIYGARQIILSYGETSLYLQTMGKNDGTGVAPVKFVKSLFGELNGAHQFRHGELILQRRKAEASI